MLEFGVTWSFWALSILPIVFFLFARLRWQWAILGSIVGGILGYILVQRVSFDLSAHRINYWQYLQTIGFWDASKLNILFIMNFGVPIISWYEQLEDWLDEKFDIVPHRVLMAPFTNRATLKRLFRQGAVFIDQMSKWFIVVTLLVWLFSQRKSDKINNAWNTIRQSSDYPAELGRIKALEVLHNQNQRMNLLDLSKVDLEGLDVSFNYDDDERAQLNSVLLDSSYLSQASFAGANMTGAKIRGAYLFGTDFSFAKLERADFKGAFFGGGFWFTMFAGANLRNAKLHDPEGISFESIGTMHDTFKGLPLDPGGAYFLDADLSGAHIGKLAAGYFLHEGIQSLSTDESDFWLLFPIHNILSARAWDSTSVFPKSVEMFLEKKGIRNGRPEEGDPGYELVDSSRELMLKSIQSFQLDRSFYRHLNYRTSKEEFDRINRIYFNEFIDEKRKTNQ